MLNSKEDGEYINSIVRAAEILDWYRVKGVKYMGVTDISRELGIQKTSVFRIVKTMEHIGWLVQDAPNGKYRIGAKLITMSALSNWQFSADDMLDREMRLLCDKYNEDVVLTGLVDGYQAVCIGRIKSENALQISSNIGRAIGMTKGSTGKVLLAYLDGEMREKAILADQPDISEDGLRELLCSLEIIRREKVYTSCSERDLGVMSISMPLFDSEGNILYSLGIVGEEHRMNEKGIDNMSRALRATTTKIQSVLSILK